MNTPTRTKAVLYCRVSSQQQKKDGHGLESQEHRGRQYAEGQRYKVVGVFKDDITGGRVDRPGMEGMLQFLEEHSTPEEPIAVVVDDIKRWARDVEVHFLLRAAVEARNGVLESPNFKFGDSPEDKFNETIMAAAAELERNQNKRQVIQKMKARLEKGYWCFDEPPGFRYIKHPEHGKLLAIDEPKASIIREALEGFACGRFPTREEMRRFLAEKGFTHRGKSGIVYAEQVTRLLTRVLYAGCVEYKPWKVSIRKGQHQGLISMETFMHIQERLKDNERTLQRKDIHADFPLRGFVLCSSCRQPMTAGWTQGRNQKYPYYRCKTKGCALHNKNIPKKKIEGEFEHLLSQVKPRKNILEIIRIELLALWNKKIGDVEAIRQKRNARLETVKKDIREYCDLIKTAKSQTVRGTYEERIEELEMEQVRLGENIQKTEARNFEFEPALDKVIEFIKDPFLMWKTGDLAQKRLVLRMVFDELLVYDREKGFYTATFSLPVELSCVPELDRMEMVEMPGIEPGSNV
ncbi:recombinase family protein [Candidatus Berkelbacteria bacterium]|nr:recombinase family protein [Candidatus Peregrinibacteria bacterium]MBI2589633.1 recombinase family protein [Candidatus Berkelbacteria bacterium]